MNQILYTIEDRESKNKIKGIMIFFGVALIIFGFILAGGGVYGFVSSKIQKQKEIEMKKTPEITLEESENQAVIKVNHVRNIQNIKYTWENQEEETITESTSTGITEYIDIPAGTNKLHVKVTDSEGKFSELEKEYSYKGTYMDVSVIDNNIKIIVTDVNGLQSVTYNWNTEEKVTQYAENTNQETIEIITEIPSGINTITVVSVNNENETTTKEKTVQGITKPTIKVMFNSDRTLFTINLKDDQGIESYSYTLYHAKVEDIAENGSLREDFKERLTKGASNNVTANGTLELIDKVELVEGFNYLEVKVRNIEGAEEIFTGWCVK